ncbi:MAG TPA: FAD-binding oxidoreductase [Candidatus Obscuribacterales bacterium]
MESAQAPRLDVLADVGRSESLPGNVVNDIHSRLNPTTVEEIVAVRSLESLRQAVQRARSQGRTICIAGGRHAMGAQQFGTQALLLDMTGHNRVLSFNKEAGTIEVEAGIKWPKLIDFLVSSQQQDVHQWGIVQKQTGADSLTLGGALSANVHGRGLKMRPIIADVESFVLVGADGQPRRVSRRQNSELFSLAVGGYGLFGVIASVELHLTPRRKLRRIVEVVRSADLMAAFDSAIAGGALYGDFQFAIDNGSDDFLRRGVLSTYQPVDPETPVPDAQRKLSLADWQRLVYLAHHSKSEAFAEYRRHYLATSGQIYWSDTHQLSMYLDDYHRALAPGAASSGPPGSEVITEIYVPRSSLAGFLEAVRDDFKNDSVNVIYGTVRLIEKDCESFLAWARDSYACVIFNLHTEHTHQGIEHSARVFRRLIDLAIALKGSYYLTYHKFATLAQLLACYPQFPEFVKLKQTYDPDETFQSDWYRHYRKLLDKRLSCALSPSSAPGPCEMPGKCRE